MRRSFVLWLLILRAATAAPAQPQSRIAFQSLRTGNWDIYVANADGSQVVNITQTSATDYSPTWAPDGRKIVFESNRHGPRDIFILDLESGDYTNITASGTWDTRPAWAPMLPSTAVQLQSWAWGKSMQLPR